MVRKAAKPEAQPQPTTGIHTVGLDIGYGEVKAVTATETIQFPSVWAPAVDMKFKTAKTNTDYPGDWLTDEEGDWYIGHLAHKHAAVGSLRTLRGRTADETTVGHAKRLRLVKAALAKLFPGLRNGERVDIRLATGLPVDHMPGAGLFKQSLTGAHRIQTDLSDFVANVIEVMVMPQPYGTIYRQMITPKGELNPCHDFTRTGVVDIGRYTIDLTLDDDGEYLDEYSGTVEAGVYRVEQRIETEYEARHSSKPRREDVMKVIKGDGCMKVAGEKDDYRETLREAVDELADAAITLMSNKWGNGKIADVIYVSGGGSHLIFNKIKALFPHAQMTDNAQLANAQGYLYYATFKAANPDN